jgi:hypothetical protein
MHPAIGKQTDEMQALPLRGGERLLENLVLGQAAVLDRLLMRVRSWYTIRPAPRFR